MRVDVRTHRGRQRGCLKRSANPLHSSRRRRRISAMNSEAEQIALPTCMRCHAVARQAAAVVHARALAALARAALVDDDEGD
eukprot:1080413-Prymnesium_polylepis.1